MSKKPINLHNLSNKEAIKYLIDNGKLPSKKSKIPGKLLYNLIKNNHKDILQGIFKKGYTFDDKDVYSIIVSLIKIYEPPYAFYPVIKIIFKNGFKFNIKNLDYGILFTLNKRFNELVKKQREENEDDYFNENGVKEEISYNFMKLIKEMIKYNFNIQILNVKSLRDGFVKYNFKELSKLKNQQSAKAIKEGLKNKSGFKDISQEINKYMGGRKKIRKHSGINQKTGKLKTGYKYSGKRLKSGLPQIIKIKN